MEQIHEDYASDKPHSFGSKKRAYDFYPDIAKRVIDEAYERNDIYTRFKQHRKPKYYNPIYVKKKRELFQCDTTFFTADALVQVNHGYNYLLCVIDVYTKMAWTYPMKTVTCDEAVDCLRDVFSKCGQIPERIQTDKGSEFKCESMKRLIQENDINHYFSYSDKKCAVVERFNLTIQQLLYKLMTQYRTYEWTKLLPQAMKIYLNREHRTIKMSPLQAEREENNDKLKEIYSEKHKGAEEHRTKPKLKVGDLVRIYVKKGNFHRGYYENYTVEYFKIIKVLTDLPIPRYKLEDLLGEEVEATFSPDELVLYTPANDEYYIDKVLNTRGRGRNKQHLVQWEGWPSKFNSWIRDTELRNYRILN